MDADINYMKIPVLIIEDHPIYREALELFIGTSLGEADVVAVSSMEEGLAHSETRQFRLILLDLGLPGVSGVEAVTHIRRKFPKSSVVIISASEDRRDVSATLRAGANAFVSKAVPTKTMAEVVNKILAGETLESPWITPSSHQPHLAESGAGPILTPRQQEALNYLCQGLTNKEIGLRLGLAEITVKFHIKSIMREFGVMNRTQAAMAARRFGLIESENHNAAS